MPQGAMPVQRPSPAAMMAALAARQQMMQRPGMPQQRPNVSPQQLRAMMMMAMAKRRAAMGGQAPARALLGVR
jgi:hypothetical protein